VELHSWAADYLAAGVFICGAARGRPESRRWRLKSQLPAQLGNATRSWSEIGLDQPEFATAIDPEGSFQQNEGMPAGPSNTGPNRWPALAKGRDPEPALDPHLALSFALAQAQIL
jgi:hypothetical protein